MLKYLVIILNDSSVSYCNYESSKQSFDMTPSILTEAVHFAYKENLKIQVVYPNEVILHEIRDILKEVKHIKIASIDSYIENRDIIIINSPAEATQNIDVSNEVYVWRIDKEGFFKDYSFLDSPLQLGKKVKVVITNEDSFDDADFNLYEEVLNHFVYVIRDCYLTGVTPQLNIVSDRLLLRSMNNCNAGCESITVAPNGLLYPCPAFYYNQDGFSIGSVYEGINIKNPQLYRLSHAPLCRNCDSYQCKRCVYLNRKTTNEIGVPSHEQCVKSHLERNAAQKLLLAMQEKTVFMPETTIKAIEYLDPFDIIAKHK